MKWLICTRKFTRATNDMTTDFPLSGSKREKKRQIAVVKNSFALKAMANHAGGRGSGKCFQVLLPVSGLTRATLTVIF